MYPEALGGNRSFRFRRETEYLRFLLLIGTNHKHEGSRRGHLNLDGIQESDILLKQPFDARVFLCPKSAQQKRPVGIEAFGSVCNADFNIGVGFQQSGELRDPAIGGVFGEHGNICWGNGVDQQLAMICLQAIVGKAADTKLLLGGFVVFGKPHGITSVPVEFLLASQKEAAGIAQGVPDGAVIQPDTEHCPGHRDTEGIQTMDQRSENNGRKDKNAQDHKILDRPIPDHRAGLQVFGIIELPHISLLWSAWGRPRREPWMEYRFRSALSEAHPAPAPCSQGSPSDRLCGR